MSIFRKKKQSKEVEALELQVANLTYQLGKVGEKEHEVLKTAAAKDIEVARAEGQVKDLDRVKSEFITIAAHQLRTPLSAVKWALDIIVGHDYKDENDLLDLAKKAQAGTKQAIEIVSSLLQVHATESEQGQYTLAPTDIKPLVTMIAEEVKSELEKRSLRLKLDISDSPSVIGDSRWLLVLFQNLIENAMKYTLAGGQITFSTETEGEFLKIKVEDSGIGIPKDEQQRIFSKFYRGTNALKVDTTGNGLGLFITQQIVDRHSGKIWFISHEKEGTTFYIVLPLASGSAPVQASAPVPTK